MSVTISASGFSVDASGKAVIQKGPNSVLDFNIDWAPWLDPNGDTLTGHTITVPAGITLESSAIVGKTVTIWLSGGELGKQYQIICEIDTNSGRTDSRSFYVSIKTR